MNRILFVNPFGIGDVLFTMPLVEAVRRAHPQAYIGFLCNERTAALVRLNPAIDQTLLFHRDHFRDLWRKNPFAFYSQMFSFWRSVREGRYDTLIDLSLGREFSFFAWCIGIPVRVGLDFKGRGIFLNHKRRLVAYEGKAVAQTQGELLELLGGSSQNLPYPTLNIPEHSQHTVEKLLRAQGIMAHDKLLAIAPGGGKSWGPNARYKQWDPSRFAEVAGQLKTRELKIVVIGDREEAELVKQVARLVPGTAPAITELPLEDTAALLKRCHLLLANDGGLAHLANFLGVKVAAIYGPVDAMAYGPFRKDVASIAITQAVPCRPCYQRFVFPPCRHERQCLEALSVETVLEAVKKIT